tara:strand:- start:4769 stop:4948 length:180 start_codon:yes stop_codon:yes gene_type:complete
MENKIVIITYQSYLKEAHPYSLETLDYLACCDEIIEIEVLDIYQGNKEQKESQTTKENK